MGRGRDRSEAIQEEQREANNRGGSRYFYVDTGKLERLGITQYKTESGANFVRIISPKFDTYDKLPYFGKKIYTHTKIGADESTFLCLRKMFGEPCPVCELMEQIKEQDSDDARLKDLAPKLRYLFLVIDVTDKTTEAKGLRWYDAPVSFNDNVAELSQDRRGGGIIDPSDPDKGKDIEFVRSGTGLSTKYKGFRFHDNEPIPDEWLEDAPEDFEEILKRPTYEEVSSAVSGGASRRDRGERRSRGDGGERRSRGDGERRSRSRGDDAEETVVEDGGGRSRRSRDAEPEREERSSRRGRRGDDGPSDDVQSRVNQIVEDDGGDDD